MIDINLDDCKGNVNKMLSKFKKKVRDSKLILELKDREFYKSKKAKKKEKLKKAIYKKKINEQNEKDMFSI